jgi:peptide chain release factor subunit 1
MPPTGAPLATIAAELDRLARFEPIAQPVVSLYVNLQANERGRDHYMPFVKKELRARARTYPKRSPERESFDRDVERIEEYLAGAVPPSAEGLALFACASAGGFFEALLLDKPVENRLTVAGEPHLYPLARVVAQHPAHAVVLSDSHAARLFVFAGSHTLKREVVPGEKISRTAAGGWSQLRYQRHVEKLQEDHARALVDELERTVRDEGIDRVILAGDDVNIPIVKGLLSKALLAKVVEILKLEVRTPEHEVMAAAAEALRRHDAQTDAEAVARVLDEYRAGGLGVAGPDDTARALANGQVDELILAEAFPATDAGITPDDLVMKARQTSAGIRIIEDASLLADVGGVAASLRFRIDSSPSGTPGRS